MNMFNNQEKFPDSVDSCPFCHQRALEHVGWRGLGLLLECKSCGCRFVERLPTITT